MRGLTFIAGVLFATLFASRVDADCDEPEIESTIPQQYETPLGTVPPNATLAARYSASAVYEGEPIVLKPDGMPPVMLMGTFDAVEGLLKAVPPNGLAPGSVYRVTWPGLRGMAGPRGKNAVVDFNVSATSDATAPVFGGIAALDWDWTRKTDPCTDELLDRYTFLLTPGSATDDGGVDALSVLVFQTSGPGIAAPRLVHIAAMPRAGKTVKVPLASVHGVGTLCFSALVRDSQMRTSNANTPPMCVTTTEAPYFEGCAFAPRSHKSTAFVGMMLAFLGLSWARRRWV